MSAQKEPRARAYTLAIDKPLNRSRAIIRINKRGRGLRLSMRVVTRKGHFREKRSSLRRRRRPFSLFSLVVVNENKSEAFGEKRDMKKVCGAAR